MNGFRKINFACTPRQTIKAAVDVCYRKSNKISIVREKIFYLLELWHGNTCEAEKRKVLKVVRGKGELKGVGVGASCG